MRSMVEGARHRANRITNRPGDHRRRDPSGQVRRGGAPPPAFGRSPSPASRGRKGAADGLSAVDPISGKLHHTHLKWSKGSRQARHRQSALHAVEPNSDTRSVSFEPQRGQATSAEASNRARLPAPRPGGEMP